MNADNEDFQFLASATVELDAFMTGFRLYRKALTEGNVGEPTPNYPVNPSLAPPAQVATGIFERIDDLIKQIRVATNYTPEIGGVLGIIPAAGPNIPVGDLQPSLKTATMPGSIVQVSFVRGSSDGIAIEMKIDKAASWSNAGMFPKSPVQLVIPDGPENLPRAVQIRARYLDGNTPVGQSSLVATTATQPSA